nr:MAG TPA: hypothetical protein [Caudoviricetes sp.]
MINKIIRKIFKLCVMDNNNKYVINGSSISVITPIMSYLTTPSTKRYYFRVYAGDFTLLCYSYSESDVPQVLIDTRDLFIHKMGFSYIELEDQSNLIIDIITKYNEKK